MGDQILITGGMGYVGSCLTARLVSEGRRVKVLDLMLYGTAGFDGLSKDERSRVTLLTDDIRDPSAVRRAMEGVSAVIHLAAISNDPTGELDEVLTRQVNFDAVGLLLATAREAGVKRFINASSSSVFGIKDAPEVTEDLEPEPLTHYSKYKALSEWLVRTSAAPDFCAVNIRPATICGYSPRQRFDLTVNKLTADAVRKKVITVHGGSQRRPNVGMTDIVNLYAVLLGTDAQLINGRTFNFGFENLKVMEIAQVIQKQLADLRPDIKVTDTKDLRDYHISSRRIVETIGYKPVSSIRHEVDVLRQALDRGTYPDIDAPEFYNLKVMKIARAIGPYQFIAR